MYGIFTFGLGHNHASTALFIEMYYNANVPSSRYFAANQREEAIAKAKEIGSYQMMMGQNPVYVVTLQR